MAPRSPLPVCARACLGRCGLPDAKPPRDAERTPPRHGRYTILDEDEAEADPWAGGDPSSARQHVVSSRMILPLPTTEPSVYTPQNVFARGTWGLALYPDTTCFYKARVHTSPSEMGGEPPIDYLVEFEDESEASGMGEPMRVPQKYVVRLQ